MSNKTVIKGDMTLGKQTEYISKYTPSLLCGIARSDGRENLHIENNALPFEGVDNWNAFELSWLDLKGKPVVACGRFSFPCDSVGIVESKSFKLYLNSLNQTKFKTMDNVRQTLAMDLSIAVHTDVEVELFPLGEGLLSEAKDLPGKNIDDFEIEVSQYTVDESLLALDGAEEVIHERLNTHLFKSNCPVTGQPDWASLYIEYRGRPIKRKALLRYLCSYRQHQDFHEQCVERIFRDIAMVCECETLTVEAFYTRRGGLDINPFRTNCGDTPLNVRLVRQ